MAAHDKIDWSECTLVEIKPGVQSGAPVLRGTRMPANAIVDNFDYGMSVSEIASRRLWRTQRAIALRILFDKNVPVGVRRFLSGHEVSTFVEM